MKNIIVTVDFSESSNNAARYAADMAAAIGAALYLVHVLDIPAVPREVPIPDYVLDEIRDGGFGALKDLADELRTRTQNKVNIVTDQETGSIERRVKEFCRWKHPFLVVRGSSQSGNPVIGRLPYPLLTVPVVAEYREVRHIVLACDAEDLNAGMMIPVEFLRKLGASFHARFEVLHIAGRQEQKAVLSFQEWQATVPDIFPELHFLHASNVVEGIKDYIEHHPTDWLVVFPKKGSLFHLYKNLSSNIVLHCPVPVMSVGE